MAPSRDHDHLSTVASDIAQRCRLGADGQPCAPQLTAGRDVIGAQVLVKSAAEENQAAASNQCPRGVGCSEEYGQHRRITQRAAVTRCTDPASPDDSFRVEIDGDEQTPRRPRARCVQWTHEGASVEREGSAYLCVVPIVDGWIARVRMHPMDRGVREPSRCLRPWD
jgi:hypothetical protein